ncbi:hypothetical protein [Nonomuraea sp. KM90]|uniref:hypothetical protein n=1 Tax=Nonomuraea sp. KM90 TaxID=3457428 RepID=UPI003FCD1CE3
MTGERGKAGVIALLSGLVGLTTAVVVLASTLKAQPRNEDPPYAYTSGPVPAFTPAQPVSVAPSRTRTVTARICNTLSSGAESETVAITLGAGGARNVLLVNRQRPTRCLIWRRISRGAYSYTLSGVVESGYRTETYDGEGTIRVFDGARYFVTTDGTTVTLELS